MKTKIITDTDTPTPTSIIQNLANEVWTRNSINPLTYKCVKSNTTILVGTIYTYHEMTNHIKQNERINNYQYHSR